MMFLKDKFIFIWLQIEENNSKLSFQLKNFYDHPFSQSFFTKAFFSTTLSRSIKLWCHVRKRGKNMKMCYAWKKKIKKCTTKLDPKNSGGSNGHNILFVQPRYRPLTQLKISFCHKSPLHLMRSFFTFL